MIVRKGMRKRMKIKEKIKGYVIGSEPVTNQTNYMVAAMLSSTIAAAAAYATGAGKAETLLVFFSLFVISVFVRGFETDKNIDRDEKKLNNQLIEARNEIQVMKEREFNRVEYRPEPRETVDRERSGTEPSESSIEHDSDSTRISERDTSGNFVGDRGYRISSDGFEHTDDLGTRVG